MASAFEEWWLQRQKDLEEAERLRAGLPSLGDVLSPATPAEKPGFWAGQGSKFMEEVNKSTALEHQTPITRETLPMLYEGAKEGISKQFAKTPWEFAKDVATAPVSLIRGGVSHLGATLKTFAEDPLEMIPVGIETAAGIAARLYPPTSAFALPIAAGARGLGEVILGGIKGENPLTIENVAETFFAPMRSLMGAGMATEAVKGAAREAVRTGATEGVGAKVAKFLDIQKLTPRLADTTVKPIGSQVTKWQHEQLAVQHALNQADQARFRERRYNGMPTRKIEAALKRIEAADQVQSRDPALYEGLAPHVLRKQVRDELERRGMLQQYLKNKENRFDLEDLATLEDGKLPLHMIPVTKEVRDKAANDENFHRQLTSDLLEDLATHEDPRKPKAMVRKFGEVDLEAAKATWEERFKLEAEMGRRLPAYKMDPKTGKMTAINVSGDEVKDGVERAMNNIQRGEFDPTQIAQVTTKIPPKPPSWQISRDAQASMDAGRGGMDQGFVQDVIDTATARIAQRHPKVMGLVDNYRLDSFSVGNHGGYDPDTKTMDITLSAVEEAAKKARKSGNIEDAYDDIEGLIEHELVHTAQSHLGLTDYIEQGLPGPKQQADVMGISEPSAYARGEVFWMNQQLQRAGRPRLTLEERKAFRQMHRAEHFENRVKPLTSRLGPEGPERLAQLEQGILPEIEQQAFLTQPGRPAGPLAVTRVPHLKDVKPSMLDRFEQQLQTVPNEKLNALSAEMRRNRNADRISRTTRRTDPNYGDDEVHNILKNFETFMDEAASGSRERGLAQQGKQAENVIFDAAQRDARNVLLEEMKEAGMKQWETNTNIRKNYEAELARTMPEVAGQTLNNGYSNLMDDINDLGVGAHFVADEAYLNGVKQTMSELGRPGFGASLVDPQYMLGTKLNDVNLARIGSMVAHGGMVKKNAVYAIGTAGDAVFKKHGVDKTWADHFMQSQKHKEFFGAVMDAVKGLKTPAEREAALRDLWQQNIPTDRGTMGPPATKPKFDEEDLPMWGKLADFGNEFMEKVRDPEFAMEKAITKDPAKLAVYQRGQLFPTSVAESELGELDDNIARLVASIKKRTEAGQTPEANHALARDLEVLELTNRRKLVLDKNQGEVGKVLSELATAHDTYGLAKSRVHAASTKEKLTDLGYSNDPAKAWRASMERSVAKAVYDMVLPNAEENLAKFMERRGTNDKTREIERYVKNYLLDQVGTRKTIHYDKMVTKLNAAGIKVKPEQVKKTVGMINTARYVMDIALNARFYPAQMTQNALMLGGLVGGENFVHGLKKVLPWNWKESAKEAQAVGAIGDDLPQMFLEDTPDKIMAKMEPLSKLVKFSEKVNRTWAYHAGKQNGLTNGLSEQEAIRHGVNVVRDTNFFMDPANRAPATNTPLGSTLMRYRSFSHMYATHIAGHMRKKNYDVVGDSLGVLMSLSGTYGIPFYGMVQSILAQQGINLPTISPPDEMTGSSIGGGLAALPGMPTTLKSVFGPVLAPGVELFERGLGKEGIAAATQAAIGRPISQVMAGAAEIARKGTTRTPSGDLKIKRTPEEVFRSMVNIAPSAQNKVRAMRAEVTRMQTAGDRKAIRALFKKERERGNRFNQAEMLSQIRSDIKRRKNQSLADLLLQR